jgi:hypothetical protein
VLAQVLLCSITGQIQDSPLQLKSTFGGEAGVLRFMPFRQQKILAWIITGRIQDSPLQLTRFIHDILKKIANSF